MYIYRVLYWVAPPSFVLIIGQASHDGTTGVLIQSSRTQIFVKSHTHPHTHLWDISLLVHDFRTCHVVVSSFFIFFFLSFPVSSSCHRNG
uniref:Uncharacterized protein n=1 Tax=Daphnia magna TaxID=35525 RepID=A0A0P6EY91_9CRUS